jgi:hypothetical protein
MSISLRVQWPRDSACGYFSSSSISKWDRQLWIRPSHAAPGLSEKRVAKKGMNKFNQMLAQL